MFWIHLKRNRHKDNDDHKRSESCRLLDGFLLLAAGGSNTPDEVGDEEGNQRQSDEEFVFDCIYSSRNRVLQQYKINLSPTWSSQNLLWKPKLSQS